MSLKQMSTIIIIQNPSQFPEKILYGRAYQLQSRRQSILLTTPNHPKTVYDEIGLIVKLFRHHTWNWTGIVGPSKPDPELMQWEDSFMADQK